MAASALHVTLDFAEVHDLAGRRLPAIPEAVRRETDRAVRLVVIAGEGEAKRGVKRDTSHYARSITHDVRHTPTAVIGLFGSNVPYARTREFGRRPGAKMPPKGVLLGWMRRHGIAPESEFALRRSIGRKGSKGDAAFQKALRAVTPLLVRQLSALPDRITSALRGRV